MLNTRLLPGVKHKVIGLVSGGKDSCFNLIHCLANGHETVALATLTPEPGIEELDSHLYQSVGTQFLPVFAQALSLPLYTGVIRGKAVSRGPEYGSRVDGGEGSGQEGDETEDLTALLRHVMAAHPEATALSSGAILSTYQRLRIEHVCARLKLTSLAYLWQQPQLPLLDNMLSCGVEAVLVKVAGVGLGVDLVGKTLNEARPLLVKLERLYGSHPAGEGGEYETFTLDAPIFSHRLRITESEVVVTDPEPYPVAYLRIGKIEPKLKEGWTMPSTEALREILGLDKRDGLDQGGRDDLEEIERLRSIGALTEPSIANPQVLWAGGSTVIGPEKRPSLRKSRWFASRAYGETKAGQSVGDELRGCFEHVIESLRRDRRSLPIHATHITLLISDMSLFASANAAYIGYFGSSPPSRATVAVPLPQGQRVRLEVIGYDDQATQRDSTSIGNRSALHVQGLSYWAPANIGPYSQAVVVDSRLFIAGQIPLLPPSLTLPDEPSSPRSRYTHQTLLALQHVHRIVDALRSPQSTGGGWTGWGESAIGWWTSSLGKEMRLDNLDIVRKAWQVWSIKNSFEQAPIAFIQAKELPRGALVEFQTNLHTGRRSVTEVYDDDDDEDLNPAYTTDRIGDEMMWESCRASGSKVSQGSRSVVFIYNMANKGTAATRWDGYLQTILEDAVSIKAYHTGNSDAKAMVLHNGWFGVPVLGITNRDGRAADIALEVFGT